MTIRAVVAVVILAALASVWTLERQEVELAAAALLVLWFAAVFVVIALSTTHERWQLSDVRAQEEGAMERAAQARRFGAQERACELLREHLDDAQREEFDRSGSFVVVGQSGRRYRVRSQRTFNVRDETDCNDYCMQFRSDPQCRSIPLEDLMLAQKLLLECDEPEFLRVANRRSATERLE